jgi:protoporphyrinogen oxidase
MIVIIGGGISGLYTATKLLGKDNITILEKDNRLGGCIFTHYEQEIIYETGAGRFNKHHKLLFDLLHEYNLTPVRIKTKKKRFIPVMCKNQKASLKTVIAFSKILSPSFLKSITFLQLCNSSVGYDKAKYLMNAFGYNAEFQLANAYTSIRIFEEDFSEETDYYFCKEGLSELIRRMEERLIANGVVIHKNTTVINITNELKVVCSSGSIIQASMIVCAVPKETLVGIPFFKKHKRLLESVVGVNLHRIYGRYKRSWFVDRTTTDLPLRQFIPIDRTKAIAMISYSDTHDADYWLSYKNNGELETELKKQLKVIFPKTFIPKMEWLRSYYWKNAVHVWKAGTDPVKIEKKIKKLYPDVKIVGESFSFRQGWIEGALESVVKNLRI